MSGRCEGESIYKGYFPSRLATAFSGRPLGYYLEFREKVTNSQRVIINTLAQYTRTILNVCLSLYSTRLILNALGQSDYGIYSVVAGVIAMLSFVTNALVTTTQRFLSVHHGKNDPQKIHQIFGNSVLLHWLIGGALAGILACCGGWIVYDVLNIEVARQGAALWVYYAAVVVLFLSFITAPVRALFIARENIVYISIVDVVDGILKLVIAVALSWVVYDKLVSYAGMMIGISCFNLLAFALYARMKFPEFHIPRLSEWNKQYIRELSHFAGWTTYSAGCVIARNQGIAVVLNWFYGTVINSAYGIAQQVQGAVQYVSISVINAMNPQIMKAEGGNDRGRMIRLSEYASKYAFLLLAMVAIPLIAEMDTVLIAWLGDVPMHTSMFCRLMLVATLCDQLSYGLTSANQAIGNIRTYSLVFYSIKLLVVVVGWICLRIGMGVASIMWCYVIVELLTSLLRLPLMKWIAGIEMLPFCKHVFVRVAVPCAVMCVVCIVCITYIDISYRILITTACSVLAGCISIWLTAINKQEKEIIKQILNRLTTRNAERYS